MSDRRDTFNPSLFQYEPGKSYPWQVFDRVTIASLIWNRKEMTERMLEAIYRHAGMPFDLLLIDNASTDGVSDVVQSLAQTQSNVRLIRNPENIGKNRGLRQLQQEVPADGLFIYLDADIEVLSAFFLVHLQKAFHAIRLETGSADAVMSMRVINCEEYGFRHASGIRRFVIPGGANALPRTSFATTNKDRATPETLLEEQVLLGLCDYVLAQCWVCPAHLFRALPLGELFPTFIGGDDDIASSYWSSLGIPMGYLENGPVARHLDWPYSEEKIRLYSELTRARATTDLSYLLWKLRNLFR